MLTINLVIAMTDPSNKTAVDVAAGEASRMMTPTNNCPSKATIFTATAGIWLNVAGCLR